jgi:uncharacterized protein (TIGR02145 family)
MMTKRELPMSLLKDIEGHFYNTTVLGNQEWMAENLRVTTYNDGSAIQRLTGNQTVEEECSPGYYLYQNDIKYRSKYGVLYNWFAIETKKLCPEGWHLPSDAEWDILKKFLLENGYDEGANSVAKSLAARTDWKTENVVRYNIGNRLSKNNRSGFFALPGGRLRFKHDIFKGEKGTEHVGLFECIGEEAEWWSATAGPVGDCQNTRSLVYHDNHLLENNAEKRCGISVRLLKDN